MDRANTPSQTLLAGAPSLLQLTHNLRFGFEQVLTTGTIYNANVEFIRGSSNSTFNLFNPFFNGLITYSLTQHVLRDFGRGVNTAKIRIARNNEKMSELQFELQIVDLVTDTLELYWDLKFGEEDVKVKQRSLDLAKRTLRDSQIQVDVGTLAPIDLIQPEADVAERNEALLTAQYDVDLLQDQLKKLISNDLDPGAAIARLNLIESIREPDSQTRLSLDTAIQHALESRREMKLADYDLENREIDVHYAKNQMLPVFNLTATYSQAGLGGRQTIRAAFDDPTIIRIIPGGIGDVFNQLFRFDHLGYATGFDLRIPIKNRAARAEYERALNERQISTQRKAATAQNIVLEVRNAYTQIQKNEARVTSTRITRELALRRLEAEQKKFDLGTSTIRFVLEEQRNLAQAETDEIEALVNYTKALIHYDRAIGNTLQRNNIEIQKQLPSQVLYQN
jgi:outer membrane protein TolC